jgi:hypothetical protein
VESERFRLRVSSVVAAALWVVACIDRRPGQHRGLTSSHIELVGALRFGCGGACSGNLWLLVVARDVRLLRCHWQQGGASRDTCEL